MEIEADFTDVVVQQTQPSRARWYILLGFLFPFSVLSYLAVNSVPGIQAIDLRSPPHLTTAKILRSRTVDGGDGVAERPLQEHRGVPWGWRVILVGLHGRHLTIEAHEDVEVDEAAALVLGDLQVGDSYLALQLRLGDSQQRGETTREIDRRVAP